MSGNSIDYDRARPPEKRRARALIRDKIYLGRLKRGACSVCGSPEADAHHEDYSKPREIVWLCRKHHAAVHAGKLAVEKEWLVFVSPKEQDHTKKHRGPRPNWAPKTHCKRGHEMTTENTIVKSTGGSRSGLCRECHRIANREYSARKKLADAARGSKP